jgi:hypothetical protein
MWCDACQKYRGKESCQHALLVGGDVCSEPSDLFVGNKGAFARQGGPCSLGFYIDSVVWAAHVVL